MSHQNPAAPSESTELISIDATIEGIAHEALAEARRLEEIEKFRKNPGPLVAPDPSIKPHNYLKEQ
jgi:hypothetical protein